MNKRRFNIVAIAVMVIVIILITGNQMLIAVENADEILFNKQYG